MAKVRKIVFALGALSATAMAASAAVPGPQRALCPSCFGMIEIADNVFIDSAHDETARRLATDIEWSKDAVEAYLGAYNAEPRIMLCTTDEGACQKLFGNIGPRGMAWGALLVRLNAEGLNRTIMVHELFHSELHRRMGHWGMAMETIPVWFNEGLAVHLSNDERFTETYTQKDQDWVLRFQTFADWKAEVNEHSWKRAYGASAARVAALEARIGRDGIVEIIEQVTEQGKSFDNALAATNN